MFKIPYQNLESQQRFDIFGFIILIFVCGFINLAIQIIGPRLLAPILGNSLEVWASMISTTLVGLTIGYFLGGQIYNMPQKVLIIILFSIALYLIGIVQVVQHLPRGLANYGIMRVFFTTFSLFALPSVGFGIISPLMVSLITAYFKQIYHPSIAGAVYGLSTLSNIIGVYVAGFFLAPYFGLKASLYAFALTLSICAIYLAFKQVKANADTISSQSKPSISVRLILREFDAKTIILLNLVFFSGFASLGTEILGSRMFYSTLGPSTNVWVITISTTLLGLSLGYFIGSIIPLTWNHRALMFVILLNAILLILSSWVIWELTKNLRYIFLPRLILASAGAFLIPSILFGMDSQLVIKALSSEKKHQTIAAWVGLVFAVTTGGGLLGAIAVPHILIPYIGLSASMQLFALGFTLFALFLVKLRYKPIVLALLITILFFPQPSWHWNIPLTLLKQVESYYQTIRIYTDEEQYLYYFLGYSMSGVADINTHESASRYSSVIINLMKEDLKETTILIIGGASHSIAHRIENIGGQVVEVELDPVVLETSNEFFGTIQGETIVNDGRLYLEQAESDRFDYIIIDAFSGSNYIPPHLVSLEVFEEIDRILKPQGYLFINFMGDTINRSNSYFALSATLNQVFPSTQSQGVLGNIILVAGHQAINDINLNLAPSNGFILTDERNPIEIFSMQNSDQLRFGYFENKNTE